MEARVRRAYVTPGHPVAFSAPGTVAKHFNISKARAREILEHLEGYTFHREFKQPRVYNPYYVHGRRKQVQGDLIDVAQLARHNNHVRFLLLLIDVMTKKVWVYPMPNKTGAVTAGKLTRWLNAIDVPPKVLRTDRGNEFTAARVQALLRRRHVEWQPAYGTLKACVAERANKSLQILMYKYLTENETYKYIDKLEQLVRTYNGRKHRTLKGMTPDEADRPANEARVQAIFHEKYAKVARHRRRGALPFAVGDMVRLKLLPKKIGSDARAYSKQFTDEYFTVTRINRTMPVAMYYVKSMDTEEAVDGGFYAQELQRLRGDVFKIDRVLRRRVRNGRREMYVKWRHFGARWNSWEPENATTRHFRGRRGRR